MTETKNAPVVADNDLVTKASGFGNTTVKKF
jgi:hypothetical protein